MIKIDFHFPNVGGVLTSASEEFNHGALWGLSRCLRSANPDAGVMIEYE